MIRYKQSRPKLEEDLNQAIKGLPSLAGVSVGSLVVGLLLEAYDRGHDEGALFVLDHFADFGHTMVRRIEDEHKKGDA